MEAVLELQQPGDVAGTNETLIALPADGVYGFHDVVGGEGGECGLTSSIDCAMALSEFLQDSGLGSGRQLQVDVAQRGGGGWMDKAAVVGRD